MTESLNQRVKLIHQAARGASFTVLHGKAMYGPVLDDDMTINKLYALSQQCPDREVTTG